MLVKDLLSTLPPNQLKWIKARYEHHAKPLGLDQGQFISNLLQEYIAKKMSDPAELIGDKITYYDNGKFHEDDIPF